jgi:hypothetical protein
MLKFFSCIVCERFLIKLINLVHDKKESKLCVRIKFISFQSASNKLKIELKSL